MIRFSFHFLSKQNLKAKTIRFMPPLVAWENLSKNNEDHFASPFLRVRRFYSYQKSKAIVFDFLVFLFFKILQSQLSLFFSGMNLQIVVNVVKGPVRKNCQSFSHFLCFSFTLNEMQAWLITPLMIVHH